MERKMMIKIISVTDNPDGSSDMIFNISNNALMVFAKIGLEKVLLDEANKVIEEYENANIVCQPQVT